MISSTCYLWAAKQTQAGMSGTAYEVTATDSAPASIAPTAAGERLVYVESVYSDWELLGTVKGEPFKNREGESFVTMRTPAMDGVKVEPAEIARNGWFVHA